MVVAAVLMVAAVYGLGLFLQGGKRPVRPRPDVHVSLPDSTDTNKGAAASLPDPCGGTGGTGQIVRVGARDITIRRKDGVEQLIGIEDRTDLRSASGAATMADLRPGQGVTIVTTDDSDGGKMVAKAVLICK